MDFSKITPATEDYLKAIYFLAEEAEPVIAARVAEEMGVSPSTMFSTLRRLQRENYVRVERHKEIHLTPKGKKVAEGILRRHFLTERLLTDVLGLDWVKAHTEAHRLEHAISEEVEERLVTVLHYPTTCPHGNPIPGSGPPSSLRKGGLLSRVSPGTEVVFESVTEGGERDARLLGYLQQHGLLPGASLKVLDVAPSLGTMSVQVDKEEFTLGIEAAKRIRVHSQPSNR